MPLGGEGGSFNTHRGGHGGTCGSTSDGGDGGDPVRHGGGGHQGRSCGSAPVGGDGRSLNTHGGGHGRTIVGPPEGGDGGSFQMHGGGQGGSCRLLPPPLVFSIGQGHGTQERIAGAVAGGVAAGSPFGGTGQMGEEQAMPSRGSRSQREVSPTEHNCAGVFSGHEGTDGATVAQELEFSHVISGLTTGLTHAGKEGSQELRAILVAVGAALWLAPAPAVAA